MKVGTVLLLLFAAPSCACALFVLQHPAYSRRPRRRVSRAVMFMKQSFDLEEFAAELEAPFQEAKVALHNAQDFPSSTELVQNIDDALYYANQVVQELQQEQQEFEQKLEKQGANDIDFLSGEEAKEVMEYLSKGLLNAESFPAFVQERKEQSRLLKKEMVKQARRVMLAKQEEASLLKQELLRAGLEREKAKRTMTTVSVALDGGMIGCSIGLFAWAALPEYLGDNVSPAVPTFFAGGVLACACLVAYTSDTPFAIIMKKIRFGWLSRTILSLVGNRRRKGG